MKLTKILTERVSDIVYRIVGLNTVIRNLSKNEFQLTPVIYKSSEQEFQRGRYFFLSLSRTTDNVYFKEGKAGSFAIYVLDGRKLSHNYKGIPVNFWDLPKSIPTTFEAEDRIISNKPVIPNATKYIKEIHVYIFSRNQDEIIKGTASEVNELANKKNIPIYFYYNKKDALLFNKRKSITNPFLEYPELYPSMNIDTKGYEQDIKIGLLYNLIDFYQNQKVSDIHNLKIVDMFEDLKSILVKFQDGPDKDKVFKHRIRDFQRDFRSEHTLYRNVPMYTNLINQLTRIFRKEKIDNLDDFIMILAKIYTEKTK